MTITEDHSHLPSMIGRMSVSSESEARLKGAIDVKAELQAHLDVVTSCLEHERHIGNLEGALDLLDYQLELMREHDTVFDEDDIAANRALFDALIAEINVAQKRAREQAQSPVISTLIEEKKPERKPRSRRFGRKW